MPATLIEVKEYPCFRRAWWSRISRRSSWYRLAFSFYGVPHEPSLYHWPPFSLNLWRRLLLDAPPNIFFMRRSNFPRTYLEPLELSFRALSPTFEVVLRMDAMSRMGYSHLLNLSKNNSKRKVRAQHRKLKQNTSINASYFWRSSTQSLWSICFCRSCGQSGGASQEVDVLNSFKLHLTKFEVRPRICNVGYNS